MRSYLLRRFSWRMAGPKGSGVGRASFLAQPAVAANILAVVVVDEVDGLVEDGEESLHLGRRVALARLPLLLVMMELRGGGVVLSE